jgi:hypothetical protein
LFFVRARVRARLLNAGSHMHRRDAPLYRLIVVTRALLDVVDRLHPEFPEVPLRVGYGCVAGTSQSAGCP